MDRRRLPLAVGILLLAGAYSLPLPDVPVGEEATHLLAAASLWHDGDLRFEPADLARGYRTWAAGPRGLALVAGAPHGELVFARPFPYAVLAAPAYGVLGPRGLRVLNMLVFLAMLWLARRHLTWTTPLGHRGAPQADRPPERPPRLLPRQSGLLVAGFFLASGAAAWVLRLQPEVFLMACAFFALATWCRVRCEPVWGRRELLPLALTGALLAVAAVAEPVLALFALPVAVDLAWARRLKGGAVFAGAFLAVALILAGVQERLTGTWGPALASEARVFLGPFPLEAAPPLEVAAASAASAADSEAGGASPRLLARRAGWLLAGRHVGLVPYFPFALFVVGLYLVDLRRRGGRGRHLLALTLLGYLALVLLRFPLAAAPGTALAAPGARAVALVYPLFLFLPRRLRAGRFAALPALAAGLWVVPALAVAASGLSPGHLAELPARGPTYRPLPLELELLADGKLPGHVTFDRLAEAPASRWLVPRETFFHTERHPEGVWVRGATRSEIYVVSVGPLEAVRFEARSIAADNVLRVVGEGDVLRARFDTPGKRLGVPVAVRPELVARGLGLFLPDDPESEHVYRFVLETTGGAVPSRVDPESDDPRFLGVFLAP